MKYLLIIFCSCALLNSCALFKNKQESAKNPFLVIVQQGQVTQLSSGSRTIELHKTGFSIRWWDQRYSSSDGSTHSIQIAASTSPALFEHTHSSMLLSASPALSPGTGLAGFGDQIYSSIFLSEDGHHYIYYENENDKRANLLSASNDILHLAWPVETITNGDVEFNLSDFPEKNIYLIVFQNRNSNESIENDEILLLTINFIE